MISSLTSTAPLSPEQLRSERPRLVRLCYRLTGNIDAAEDLAQETLVEALRNAYKLHDPAGTAKWLSAIARNVCLRWNERRGRDLAHRLPASCGDEGSSAEAADLLDIADVSGGQWQRIALARAFFRDAELLVLDEPTAALDPLAELALYERFVELVAGRTAIMIAHRLGMARLADRVLVLDQGAIAEEGSHEDLMAAGGLYARMFKAQAQWYRA